MVPVRVASRSTRRALATGLPLALAASALTAALGLAGSPMAFPVGALLSALLALLGGSLLVQRASSAPAERFRTALGAAVVLWGLGQALVAVHALVDPHALQAPTLGDLFCTAAAPLALVGLLSVPRAPGEPDRRGRLGLDALLMGAAAAVVLWQVAFRGLSDDPTATALAVVVVVAELSVLAMFVLVAVATLDRGIALTALGVALFVAGDLVSTRALTEPGGTWPWLAASVACVGWPLACIGVLDVGRRETGPRRLRRTGAEVRTGMTTTALVVGLGAALALAVAGSEDPLDAAGGRLLFLTLVLFGARELVALRVRGRQVRVLTEQALHDPLTGLGNRRALAEDLADLADRRPATGSVVVLDLDGFTAVNDRVGHVVGDRLLVDVATAVRRAAPADWTCYRVEGDELALLGPAGLDAATTAASAVLDAVRACSPAVDGESRLLLTASAGVAPLDGTAGLEGPVGAVGPQPAAPESGPGDPLAALSGASTALHEAKRAGRDRVVVHSRALAAAASRRALVAERLRGALAEGSLDAALQPVVDIATGTVVAFEVLSRWTDPELGVVPPDEFVPVAEQHGLVAALGSGVLRQGLMALRAAGGVERRVRMSVNASPLELREPGYREGVLAALREAGVPADLLVVEVTEAVYVTVDDPAVATLEALVADGVRVAVDDFGTGYSSLSYLDRLPVHLVKIDRALTEGLAQTRTRVVVEALVRMSRALDLEVVAEGVEDAGQAAALTELGVRLGQGWLWSRAVPTSDVAVLGRLVGGAPTGPLRPAPQATSLEG